jgi:hypothetical protein
VLALDLPRQLLTIGQGAPDDRPQHGLLGVRVPEHQAPDARQDFVLLRLGRLLQLLQQAVQLDVVAMLAHQDAAAPAALLECLLPD